MRNNAITRRQFIAATGALGTTMGLAACGGGQSNENADAGATDLTKLTFCLDYTPNTNHTGIYVAQKLGYFAEEGIEVEIVQPAEDGAEAMVGTGQAEVGVSYQDYLAGAYQGGNTGLFAVAAIIQHNTSGIMSKGGLGITHPAAMEDKRYATWELDVEQATVKQVVEDDGGDFSKIIMVPYTVDDEIAGFKADLFDSVWAFEGWAGQNAAVQGYDVDYFSFVSINEVFDYYTPVIVANIEYAEAHPDIMKAFLRGAKKGYEYCIEHVDEAADILLEAAPEIDAQLAHASQAYLADQYVADAPSWGVFDGERWSAFYEWLSKNTEMGAGIDVNAGWTNDYLE